MKHILMILMLWLSLPAMAQRLVCESSPIDIGEKNAIKDKNGNFYAVIRVYALGFDINTLEIKKDGLIDDIIKRNTYYEVYIVCTGYKTKIEMSTRTNGYLSVPIITQGDYSDSNDEEYDVGRGAVYKLEIKLEQVRPSLFRITENQYIENLSHKSALQGTTVSFEVQERDGYTLDYVTIDGKRINQDSRLYSFTMPAKDVHIAAYYTQNGFEGYEAYAVLKDSTLTFYYDKNKPKGAFKLTDFTLNTPWKVASISTVVFDKSFKYFRPTSCKKWFYDCKNLKTIIGMKEYLNTEKVTDMSFMFSGCEKLTSLDVRGFNTEKVTNMSCMFDRCEKLTSLDVSGFNTENVTSMGYMFSDCKNLTSLDVSGFKTENVTSMGFMFSDCKNLTSLDVSGFKTEKVTNMEGMFSDCKNLTSLDVSGFKTENVTNMGGMFARCVKLTSLDVSGFKTEKVTDMGAMFSCCINLTSLDVSGFKTEKVTDMGVMFYGCVKLTSLDVSGFKTEKVTSMWSMFAGCKKLNTIYVGNGWIINKVDNSHQMFYLCKKLRGEKGTRYHKKNTDSTYAKIDGGENNPGYLTKKK